MPKNVAMNDSQFELITLTDGSRISRPRSKLSSGSYDSDSSSIRSNYVDMEDRELAHAIKRIYKLDAEIRANEDAEGQLRSLKDRINVARQHSAATISQLNEKMDEIEQVWDDTINQEQKDIAKEILLLLKELKADDLSQALRKKRRSSRSRSSSRSTSASRSQSTSSSVHSSSMSKKIAHLDKKERQFAGRAVEVKKDARQIDAMNRNLDSLNELERVVCSKLGRLQSVGDVKPGSAVYGTVELVESYKNSVEHLAKAIRSLSDVSCLPAITNNEPITKAEIDKICVAMTEFMGRIEAQLSSNRPSAENTASRPQTSVRVAQRSSARLPPQQSSSSSAGATNSDSGAGYASARATPTRSTSSTVAASTAQSIESHQG